MPTVTFHHRSKLLFFVPLAITLASPLAAPRSASAQTANFVYSGVPTTVQRPGDSFTVGVNLAFTPGGNMQNVAGLSYWMTQTGPVGSNFPLLLTDRNTTGTVFSFLQTDPLQYPQILDPINRNPDGSTFLTDLGGSTPGAFTSVGPGMHFVANLTFVVAQSAVTGVYSIGNTIRGPGVGGRFSVIFDSTGSIGLDIAPSRFSVAVFAAPDGGSTLTLLLGTLVALVVLRRASGRQTTPSSLRLL